jgi:cytochrome c-type protein NrfB
MNIRNVLNVTLMAMVWLLVTAASAADNDVHPDNCIGCHDDTPMLGTHGGHEFGLTNLVAECADCHGSVTDLNQHKLDGTDLIRFGWMQSSIPDQNNQCLTCHEGESLGLSHWTHDAHGEGLSCASCHSLHSTTDPVRGLSDKATIQLCVDCHSKQQDDEGVF